MLPALLPALLPAVTGIIDKIFPDPAEREKAKSELLRMQQEGELQELEVRMSAILAEAKSKDPWTSRARPSFMYVVYVMILASIPMGVLSIFNPESALTFTQGFKAWFGAIPTELWTTFTIGYCGYTAGRTLEKRATLQGRAGPLSKFLGNT